MLVENISLPEAVEKALDQRTSMGVIGDLHKYTQFKTAEAIGDPAKNPNGMAGGGMGMGMGFAMANQMGQAMSQPPQQPPAQAPQAQAPAPPPLPQKKQYHVAFDGEQKGPFDVGALQSYVQSGQLTRYTLVWTQGMTGWSPASQVPTLASLFGSMPPPLPS